MRLKSFKQQLQEHLLDLLWRQWCAIGVYGDLLPARRLVIDPETLLLMTCSLGRLEPRMFDEALDWLAVNGNFINTQRLATLLKQHPFTGQETLTAIAAYLNTQDKSAKWRSLSQATTVSQKEPLFQRKDGRKMASFGEVDPVFAAYGFLRGKVVLRRHSQVFDPVRSTCFLLKLRAFCGVNARAETCLYLSTHPRGAHPSLIARESGYYQKTIQDVLVNMTKSGLVRCREAGREKIYSIREELVESLQLGTNGTPQWMTWPPVLVFLASVYFKLDEPGFFELDPLVQSTELRKLTKSTRKALDAAGFIDLTDIEAHHRADAFLTRFSKAVLSMLKKLK
ncbi:MAG: hypothetical protein QNJ97_24100 [Myxococcota bacterium]|nr:hypothetical protein [Myxococcota bacterium]